MRNVDVGLRKGEVGGGRVCLFCRRKGWVWIEKLRGGRRKSVGWVFHRELMNLNGRGKRRYNKVRYDMAGKISVFALLCPLLFSL